VAFAVQEPLEGLAQIGNQMVAVSHLDGLGGTLLCSLRIGAGAVATHHLNTRMGTQPCLEGLCLSIWHYEGYPLVTLCNLEGIERLTLHNAR
jgi:hypothetical protein